MKIIGADERLAEKRGAKILIVGPTGIGKTRYCARSIPRARSSSTRGRRPLRARRAGRHYPCRRLAHRRRSCVQDRRAKPVVPADQRLQHSTLRSRRWSAPNLDRYDTIFVDSITEIARLSFRHAEQQPEAISERTGARTPAPLTACMAGRWCVGCSNCSTPAERTSSSSPCSSASPTNSTVHRMATAARGRQDRARAPRHRRPGRHHAVGRFRRWQACARLCVHVAKPVGISRERSQRPARTIRAARSRQTDRQAYSDHEQPGSRGCLNTGE